MLNIQTCRDEKENPKSSICGPIKLIIFDLDGVLVDSRNMHYEALNRALQEISPRHVIPREKHLSTYDGLSTTKKLNLLTEKEHLPKEWHHQIWAKKQEYTRRIINEEYSPDDRIIGILRTLKLRGYTIHVASNCIHTTVRDMLLRKEFMGYIDYFASNESVRHPKPNPEIYFHCMMKAGVGVSDTVILEDSHVGREAARQSGAHLLQIENPEDLTLEKIDRFIEKQIPGRKPKWFGHCNVVIPMSGYGSRFANAGYILPKPLIPVRGKPMIQVAVENLNFSPESVNFIFIVRMEHIEKYNVQYILNLISPGCTIIPVDEVTEGAACSVLLAEKYINNNEHLFIANSDQFVEWNCNEFMYSMMAEDVDGGIATFRADSTKWSYAKTGKDGFVTEVAEKKCISEHATVGFYYWNKGSDFVKYTRQMIENDVRVNNEYYVCPVFNEAIRDSRKIKIFPVEKMWGIGTPEDLTYFLDNYQGDI